MFMRKKIFIEAASLTEPRTSGVGNTALNIVRYLAAEKNITDVFDIHLLVPFNKTQYLERYKLSSNISVDRVFIPGKLINFMTRFKIFPYIDIFFGKGVYIFPNYRNWPLLFSKNITYIHDMTFMRYPKFVEDKNRIYLKNNIHTWANRANTIVAVSQHAKQEFNHFFPQYKDKTTYVYNGYDDSIFYPRKKVDVRVLKKYGLQKNGYFFHLSNIEPRKNIAMLLRGYEQYQKDTHDYDTKLLLVGGMSWDSGDIEKIIRRINHNQEYIVRPKQFVPDDELPELMNGCLALVHTAWYEGFGISPLQAMACEKHVMVPHNSSIPEIVGECGVYIDESSIEEVARGLATVKQEAARPNTCGVQRAKTFTWNKTLQPLFRIILAMKSEV